MTDRQLVEIFQKHRNTPGEGLIDLLRNVQKLRGFLNRVDMESCARFLGIPPARLFGVATFYREFHFRPDAKHKIELCRGTSCHVKGSAKLLDHLAKKWNLEAGKQTPDGLFELNIICCMGACSSSPAVRIDGELHSVPDTETLDSILEKTAKEIPL